MARGASRFVIEADDGTRHTVIRQPHYIDRPSSREAGDFIAVPSRATLRTSEGLAVTPYADGTYRVEGSRRRFRRLPAVVPDDDAGDDD